MKANVLGLVMAILGTACVRHNPASCCTSTLQCAALGLDQTYSCDGLAVCDSTGTCVPPECITSSDCKSSDRPLCSNELCVPTCMDDAQCSAATPHCASSGACVECTLSSQCPSAAPVCDANNTCVAGPPACVRRLLFFRGSTFGGQLFQIGLDDLTEHPLFDEQTETDGSYAPDGTKIAFVRGLNSLWVVDANGQNEHLVTSVTGNLIITSPTWSVDGTGIAYEVLPFGDETQAHIWVTDLAGNTANITTNAQAASPRWSPDGTHLLFTSSRTGNLDIFTMSATGSNQTNLTHRAGDDIDPRWSPDGNSIVFGAATVLWRMNSDGSNAQMITSSAANSGDDKERWISNQQIIYDHFASPTHQLFVTSPQGINQHAFAPNTGTNGQSSPVPSSDGKFVAWSEQDGASNDQIWYSGVDPVSPIRITNAGTNTPVAWQYCAP